mmetsp:Transcript_6718/g.27000  ORF Transcript_6718/g.27000 Transcript_6718/m.27000 type:complete len:132 (+) Transcript_6718:855-1250(+)
MTNRRQYNPYIVTAYANPSACDGGDITTVIAIAGTVLATFMSAYTSGKSRASRTIGRMRLTSADVGATTYSRRRAWRSSRVTSRSPHAPTRATIVGRGAGMPPREVMTVQRSRGRFDGWIFSRQGGRPEAR